MNQLHIETLPVGLLEVNCYVVWPDGGAQCLIIDPGGDGDMVVDTIRQLGLEAAAVLLTHAHVDHIGGVKDVATALSIPVYVHAADRELYLSPANALLPWLPAVTGLPEPVDALPPFDGMGVKEIHTPGHTPGGVCYYVEEADVLFAGDTLFCGSIGRADLPGGEMGTLLESIRAKLLTLPASTVVYPGHGPTTTIGDEKVGNPFVR